MLRQLLIGVWIALALTVSLHQAAKTDLKFFLVNNKGLDYQFAGKADAHRFGVELKENKQFHHTITAEDGVRLGCYGFELEGKKYSTNYIADGKGYRLAPTDTDLITVYCKGCNDPRIASFIESFNEDEIKAANIRYLFPDGCTAPKIIYDPNNPSTQYENRRKFFQSLIEKHQKSKNDDENNKPDKSITSKTQKSNGDADHYVSKNGNENNNNNDSNKNKNIDNSNNHQNARDDVELNKNRQLQQLHQQPLKNPNGYHYEPNKIVRNQNFDCCNADSVQFILPQNDSCSQNTARLIIPISSEKLSSISITDFANIQLSSSVSFVLKELQYLVQKYNL